MKRASHETIEPAPRLPAYLRLARPKQWLKNVLVIAAPAAAGVLTEGPAALDTAIAFVCFCLAASGTYFINDAHDVEADRMHPTKRTRPIAAGEVSVHGAIVVGIALAVAGGIALTKVSSKIRIISATIVAAVGTLTALAALGIA